MVQFVESEVAKKRVTHPVPKPTHCHSCQSPNVDLMENSIIYRTPQGNWPIVWYCWDCHAAVGCHPQTFIPTGFMADSETRRLRKHVHRLFDPLWKGRPKNSITRSQAYEWLADQMGLALCVCHISYFDTRMCRKALKILTTHRRNGTLPK